MIYIRSLIFNVLAYGVIALGCIANSIMGVFNRDITIKAWNYVVLPTVVFLLKHIAKITIEVRGKEYLNQDNAVYTLTTLVPKATYVMKKELTKIPVFGWAQAFYGIIPVDRSAGSAAMKTMLRCAKEMVEKKRPIIIFPEGTRRKPGQEPAYKPGVALLYQHLNMPVIPIASNTGFFWAKNSSLRYTGKIIYEIMTPIQPGLNKKEFMEKLQNTIEEKCNELNIETINAYPYVSKMMYKKEQ